MKKIILTAFCILAAISCSDSKDTLLVREVDHILLETSHSKELFTLLLEKFELPVIWKYKRYNDFVSGGLNFGNVHLEVIKFDDRDRTSGINGIAFEPTMKTAKLQKHLDKRRLLHSEPRMHETFWTITYVYEMLYDKVVFFCEYHFPYTDKRSYDGGPLGIEKVIEMKARATDLEKTIQNWNTLLSPLKEKEKGYWEIGEGPALRITSGEQDEINTLLIKVKSLENAKAYLDETGLLGKISENKIATDPDKMYGIMLEFTEQDPDTTGP